MSNLQPKSAIWVRLPRFIGDSIMISRALEPLRQSGVPLVAWGPEKVVELFRGSNAFAAVRADGPEGRGAFTLARVLRQAQAIGVVSLARSIRPLLAGWLARIPLRVGWQDAGGRFLATHSDPWWQHGLHHLDRYGDLLAKAFPALPRDVRPQPFRPRPEAEASIGDLLRHQGFIDGFVVLALGGNEWNKRLEAGPWIELLRSLEARELPAILVGHGPEDEALAATLLAGCSWPLSLVGSLQLAEIAALLGQARAMVGNDSAAAHLAAAMGCPVVAVFGPTRPDWSVPRGPCTRVVRREDLTCLACGQHGCPVPGHPCMHLPVEALLTPLLELLRSTPSLPGEPLAQ